MGHAALRKGRRSITGQVYLVTFTTAGRACHFEDWSIAADASRILGDATSWAPSRLLAWVLMPDHCHPDIGRIWDRGFHDRALRAEDDVRAAARYLIANPLRAGLVEQIGDYPFWDAIWLRSDEPL